jgi:polyhydroxyalkanoate synthesis regulator phasin
MNTDSLVQFVQKGFHVTLGAANFVAESIQDPQKRDENMAKLNSDFNVLSEEWAIEGEKKEKEARQFVETLMGQPSGSGSSTGSSGFSSSVTRDSGLSVPSVITQDLKELTEQLASIRLELEQTRESQ